MIDWEATRGRVAIAVSCWEECRRLIDEAIEAEPKRNSPWTGDGHSYEWYKGYTSDGTIMAFHTDLGSSHCMTYTYLDYFVSHGYKIVQFSEIFTEDNDFEFDQSMALSYLFGLS